MKSRDMSLPDLKAGGLLASHSERIENAKRTQNHLVELFTQLSTEQLDRARQEMEVGAEFSRKFTGARSLPDVMDAYQNWLSTRMAMSVTDTQRAINATMRLLSLIK